VTISPIDTSNVNRLSGAQHSHSHGGARKAAFDAAAKALGMTSSDLRASLKSGQTMASLASSKAVSTDTLTAAITTALQGANPSLSADRAATLAQRMVQGPHGSQGAPAGGHVDRDNDGD